MAFYSITQVINSFSQLIEEIIKKWYLFKAMFVYRKIIFRKLFFKFFCVCLSLEKLVNGKHFLVNGKHFPVNFSQRKIWLGFQESIFPLAVFVFRKVVSGKSLSKFSCVCLLLGKLVNGKHFPVKGKFILVFRKVFS